MDVVLRLLPLEYSVDVKLCSAAWDMYALFCLAQFRLHCH